MFFRQKKSPSGQCLQLLESYRNGQGQPRQHVVVSLGGLTIAQADRALIARLVEQRLHGQTQLQCLSDNAGALSLADSISKRVEREGRWRPIPVAACPDPSEGASATIDGVMLGQALAPQSLDCPPQKSRYPSTPLFLESALEFPSVR